MKLRPLFWILAVILSFSLVSAFNVDINEVYVNGINVEEGIIQVESGNVPIVICLEGNEDIENVRFKAWIGNNVEYSEMFDVEDGVLYKKTLNLNIPENIEGGDYTLHLDIFDSNHIESYEYDIFVESGRRSYHYKSKDESVYISISSIKDLVVDEDSTYKVQITNLESVSKTFYLKVSGMDVDYDKKIVVPAGSSGILEFTLSPDSVGQENIFIEVSTDKGVVAEELYSVEVVEKNDLFVYVVSLFIGVIVILSLVWYLQRYRE